MVFIGLFGVHAQKVFELPSVLILNQLYYEISENKSLLKDKYLMESDFMSLKYTLEGECLTFELHANICVDMKIWWRVRNIEVNRGKCQLAIDGTNLFSIELPVFGRIRWIHHFNKCA